MTIKIAHISDIHLRNDSRHNEYIKVFDKFKSLMHEEKPDMLVITGDVAHTKSTISPEYVSLFASFLRTCKMFPGLLSIYITPGNHDINEKNRNRLDTISPIVDIINNENGVYIWNLLTSCVCDISKNASFVNFSILDSNRELVIDPTRFNIGLFHGIINGAQTSLGHVLTTEDESFLPCDLYMLGDVHKRQKLTILGHDAYYAGSMIQQDHGESQDKGGIIYEIDDINKTFEVRYFDLENSHKFVDIKIEDYDKNNIDKNNKIRIIGTVEEISNFRNTQKSKISNTSYKLLKTPKIEESETEDKQIEKVTLNLESIEKIIRENFDEYVKLYGDDLFNMNAKYLKELNSESDNIYWKINNISWSNMFNYGKDISLDFSSFRGNILGIFGKNKTGKSSVIDAICYSIYGKWTKRSVTNDVYINSRENQAETLIEIEAGGIIYRIERTLKRKLKGASSTVKLLEDGENICGDDKKKTELKIVKIFGKLENFLMTTILKQYDDVSFLKSKSSSRKETLNQFLGLDSIIPITEKIGNDLSNAKAIKINLESQLENFSQQLETCSNYDDLLLVSSILEDKKVVLCSSKIVLQENINLGTSYSKRIEAFSKITTLKEKITTLELKINVVKIDVDNTIIEMKHPDSRREKRIKLKELLEREKTFLTRLKSLEKDVSLLKEVPCGTSFPQCKFLVSANESKNSTEKGIILLEELRTNINSNYYDSVREDINTNDKSDSPLYLINDIWINHSFMGKELTRDKQDLLRLEANIFDYNETHEQYYNILDKLNIELNELNEKIILNEKELSMNSFLILKYNDLIKDQKGTLEKLTKAEYNFNILNSYSKIMGKSGVVVHLLNSHIEQIKILVNILLSSLCTLEVDFEIGDSKFDIYFKDVESDEFKTIECASGMEEFVLGLAIRLTLNKVSMISKNSFVILDEPGTALDIDNQKIFGDTLVNLLGDFDNIIIVTHLEILKDYVNKVVNIDIKDGYSYL